MIKKTLYKINFAVLLQQQRYIVAISFLFYLANGLTLADFLLFQSIFYFTGLIAEIPAGYIGDIFPRKNVLIFSYLLFMVRIILWITMPNYYTILLGEILYGLSKAFYRGVSDSYIYDYLKANNATELMPNKYGKFNFFMSTGSAISCLLGAWLFKYVGFSVLLGFELFFNSTAVFVLFFLPQIPQTKNNVAFKDHFMKIFNIVKNTMKNSQLNIYLIYAGILTGITSVFVWNFQPFMKNCLIPVALFGVVYFVNHMLRALGSISSNIILNKISLEKVACVVWFLYLMSFLFLWKATDFTGIWVCLSTLMFICFAIGVQMIFNVGNISRIHGLIPSDNRATISSINSMLASLFSGTFLMIFKSLSGNSSIKTSLSAFIIFFLFTVFIVLGILINKKNQQAEET